jgi:hypothetical protein
MIWFLWPLDAACAASGTLQVIAIAQQHSSDTGNGLWISILVTTIRETTSGTHRRRVVEVAAAPAIAIVMTTGANLLYARAIAITMTHGRSDAVLETTGKGQTGIHGIAIMMPVGPSAIATIETVIAKSRMHSLDTFTCRVDQSANWFMTAIASTPCVLQRSRELTQGCSPELDHPASATNQLGTRFGRTTPILHGG